MSVIVHQSTRYRIIQSAMTMQVSDEAVRRDSNEHKKKGAIRLLSQKQS
ncbi:DeoR family transcriptional regulator [Photobacterium obscurum]